MVVVPGMVVVVVDVDVEVVVVGIVVVVVVDVDVVVVDAVVVVVDDELDVVPDSGFGENSAVNVVVDRPGARGNGALRLSNVAPVHVGLGSGVAGMPNVLSTTFPMPVAVEYGVPVAAPLVPVVRCSDSGPTGQSVPRNGVPPAGSARCAINPPLMVIKPVPGSRFPVQSEVGSIVTTAGMTDATVMLNGAKVRFACNKLIAPSAAIVPVPVPLMPSMTTGVVPLSASDPTQPAGGLTAGHPNCTEIAPGFETAANADCVATNAPAANTAAPIATANTRMRLRRPIVPPPAPAFATRAHFDLCAGNGQYASFSKPPEWSLSRALAPRCTSVALPSATVTTRIRREPPAFRTVAVRETTRLGPRLMRIGLGGSAMAGFALPEPAASVRLLLPSPGANELVMPRWNGNEFLLADGTRPVIRTLTPRRFDEETRELDVEIVLHGAGVASRWAEQAQPGDAVAVSGPGRGYTVDASAPAFVLAGDETAIPAIAQLLEMLPVGPTIDVHIEVANAAARIALPEHPCATVVWHDAIAGAPPGEALVNAIRTVALPDDARVWAAGEAAAMQRIRRHLFDERGVARAQTTIRGYWKVGRGGDSDDD